MKYFIIILFLSAVSAFAAESDELCFECHSDMEMYKTKNGKRVSLYVNLNKWKKSVHFEKGCIGCHKDIYPEDLPHEENLEKVKCSDCHATAVSKFESSLHGAALKKGKRFAPTCETCHGKHEILSHKDHDSKTYVMNIPMLCGQCHQEGTPVSKLRTITKHNVLENYSQSIHGEGLYKRGLIVSAVCTNCHMSHDILPHENPKSSINRYNIAKTCMQCHAEIELVHTKVIEGKLWEKKPHEIPVCVDCHQPHKTRKILYERSFPNESCMNCHSDSNLHKIYNGEKRSLFVDTDDLKHSTHKDISCIKCHSNINPDYKPICVNSGKVDCSMCHAEQVVDYQKSYHGALYRKGNEDAPYCTDCHGKHDIKSKKDRNSSTYVKNIPDLCANCHQEGKPARRHYKGTEHEVVKHYKMSIHGKGLLESGLIVTATCVDCHTSHGELPANDAQSSVHRDNIAETCGNCHQGIYEQLQRSVHSPLRTKTDKELPVCNDCHFSHSINRVDLDDFRQTIISQCGRCHEDVTDSYFDTFHGKVSKLGSEKTAKCYDCHGAHDILSVSNPNSKLSRENIVETCKQCHTNSNRKFVGYLTHATHHNKEKYPFLYYTFWIMTLLLIGTFSFFGIHTLLWIPRSIAEKRKREREKKGILDI